MAEPADHQTHVAAGESSEAVQMSEIDTNDHINTQTEAGPSLATHTVDTTMTPATGVAVESAKGKEKGSEEAPVVPSKEEKTDDTLAIEPSTSAVAASPVSDNSVCNITLLLPTGARHPYKIDEKYLAKRNVTVPEKTESGKMDPFSISIYTLKELILREWREEWDNKPANPSSIRLIHFGKLLEDKEQLKKYQFSRENPNVVHMSVRPAEMLEEDEAAKGKAGSTREGRRSRREGTSESCCVIL